MKQLVIGIVGPIASGKGAVAAHLQDAGFFYQSLSDRVREEAAARSVQSGRENLQNIGNELRQLFGNQVLAERTARILIDQEKNIVIDSIRNPGEIVFLKSVYPQIYILGIDAPIDLRLRWYLERSIHRHEDSAAVSDFFTANNRDFGIGEESSGQQVARCLEMADLIIFNNGSKKELFNTIDISLSKELSFTPEGYKIQKERK